MDRSQRWRPSCGLRELAPGARRQRSGSDLLEKERRVRRQRHVSPPPHPPSQFGCMDVASVQLFPQDDELTIRQPHTQPVS